MKSEPMARHIHQTICLLYTLHRKST